MTMTVDEIHAEISAIASSLKPWELKVLNMVLDTNDPRENYEKYRAVRPGNSPRTAKVQISKFIHRDDCERYMALQKQLAAEGVANRLGLTEVKLLKEISNMALVNPKDYLDEFGMLKPLEELTREQAAAVRNFQEVRNKWGGVTYRYQLYDKHKALELLGKTKAVQLFTESEKVSDDLDSLLEELKK